ncbi:TRZ/ATZ family hydrolase [Marinomonas sp. 15G1-11]|uniref:TRZ/ATZ family hydrolase n=1 Tax=Marinomonas phaeophyticola TaxID=3004091 RepID=A0ABT4K016_9GAMM|nr:TRZ/ATZ family hydrolase [Marinomonas sp. 15G1-11]MCZ2723363.1 TRZ/ATZ family hydrolase [Marinomonas sp. 15G1-11]
MSNQLNTLWVDTIVSPKWIATSSSQGLLSDHSVVIQNGTILAILPTNEWPNHYQTNHHFALENQILTPGFINTHGHAAMTLFRGYADDLPLMTWLKEHIWPNEAKWLSDDFVNTGTELAIAEMIKSGTTTFSDNYFFSNNVGMTAEKVGIRAQLCPTILTMPTAWANSTDEYLSRAIDTHLQFKESTLINGVLGPHSPYILSDEELTKVVHTAQDLGCMIQMHVHETQAEITDSLAQFFCRPLARLKRVGMLNNKLQAVHMTQLTEHEIELIAEHQVKVLHCPESNLKLASGFCPVNALKQAGVTVALGTDGAASNNDLDMLGEMRTASLLAKAVGNDATALDAEATLKMATIEGAKALNIDHITGSIEIGKSADLCATSLDDLSNMPIYNPISQLIYTATRNQISHVWVAGNVLLKNHKLTTIDTNELRFNVNRWHQKINRSNQTFVQQN